MRIKWSKKAEHSFDKIIEFIIAEWSLSSAIQFIRKSNAFIEILKLHPEIGKREDIKTDLRSFVLTRQVTVFYRIKDQHTIIFLNFFDTRQNPTKK